MGVFKIQINLWRILASFLVNIRQASARAEVALPRQVVEYRDVLWLNPAGVTVINPQLEESFENDQKAKQASYLRFHGEHNYD
ncbi:hypothetical protein ASG89_23020 [Paenibacillus sp. Soil766]|nr:hypothetical protein ASG89_23020 [Paenibacillus sp. Soil766]